jgi:hypothetical protein
VCIAIYVAKLRKGTTVTPAPSTPNNAKQERHGFAISSHDSKTNALC